MNDKLEIKKTINLKKEIEKEIINTPKNYKNLKEIFMKKLFNKEFLFKHYISEYDYFITHKLKEIFKSFNDYTILEEVLLDKSRDVYKLKFFNYRLENPLIFVDGSIYKKYTISEIMHTKKTLGSKIFLEIELYKINTVINEKIKILPKKEYYIGDIPVMVGSKLLGINSESLDLAGYFILNGMERIVLNIEEVGSNILYGIKTKTSLGINYTSNIYSKRKGYKYLHKVTLKKKTIELFNFPVKVNFNAFDIIKALGLSDQELINEIAGDNEIIKIKILKYLQIGKFKSREEAFESLSEVLSKGKSEEYRHYRLNFTFDKYLLIHIGFEEEDRLRKGYYLCQMLKKVLYIKEGLIEPDFLDDIYYKRVRTINPLLRELVTYKFKDVLYDLGKKFAKNRITTKLNLASMINSNILKDKIYSAFISGNWVGGKSDVTVSLDRINYVSSLCTLRKILLPLSKNQKFSGARMLIPSHWGRFCPVETPHSISCGLVKSLAIGAIISSEFFPEEHKKLVSFISKSKYFKLKNNDLYKKIVYLNGEILGYSKNLEKLYNNLILLRRKGVINYQVSFSYNLDSFNIFCDPGRILRLLLVVKNRSILLNEENVSSSLDELFKTGIVEAIDVSEESILIINNDINKLTDKTTHLEIDKSSILGYTALLMPYFEYNSTSKGSVGVRMLKQAVSKFIDYSNKVGYIKNFTLINPEIPIVKTKVYDYTEFSRLNLLGNNVYALISSFKGYTIEDSIILNKAAVERGLFDCFCYRSYYTKTSSDYGWFNTFKMPEKGSDDFEFESKYKKIDFDGIIKPNSKVVENEILVSNIESVSFSSFTNTYGDKKIDKSVKVRPREKGVVDSIIVSSDSVGQKTVGIKIRDYRRIVVGDKLSSRHAQKGILGKILHPEDMYYSKDGFIPDIILSSHGVIPRMTMGHLTELLAGFAGVIAGRQIDGTPFSCEPVKELEKILENEGYDPKSKELFRNPDTGNILTTKIFSGFIYYMRLYHMVQDKIYARARGPLQIMTGQPTEGRNRQGGLRFGEMERDVLMAYGAAYTLKERLYMDKIEVIVCNKCNIFVNKVVKNEDLTCTSCNSSDSLFFCKIPYSFNLLKNELNATHIDVSPFLTKRF